MLSLAVKDFYKSYLHLDPGYMAQLESFSGMPWSVKLLYGMISDNIPICGSKRKSYVVILGALQFLSLLFLYLFETENEKVVSGLLFLTSLSGAYLDVIVDALMVVESRQDSDDGSEQLSSLSWGAMGAGGMFGSLIGAYVTEYSHPKYSFLTYSIFGLIVMILGLNLDSSAQEDPEAKKGREEENNLFNEIKKNLGQIYTALSLPEIY